jgi:hypothetical protein
MDVVVFCHASKLSLPQHFLATLVASHIPIDTLVTQSSYSETWGNESYYDYIQLICILICSYTHKNAF